MKLLAVETSTDACSAALYLDGKSIERFELTPKAHTRLILPMIDELMAQAQLRPQQLDALALSRGPGSFTGVRIAAGVVQGIAYGADLPVVLVSTLAAMAQDFFNHIGSADVAFTGLDARMDEVFWGVYQKNTATGLAQLVGAESVTRASQVFFPERAGFGVGSAWSAHETELTGRIGGWLQGIEPVIWPKASAIAQLAAHDWTEGLAVPVEAAMPVYLRDKVADTEAERRAKAAQPLSISDGS